MILSIVKKIRIEIHCSLFLMSYFCGRTFREWWRNFLDYYYYNNYFWCVHFKVFNDINVSYILLYDIIKKQQIRGSFIRGLLFFKSMRDNHLSNLLPILQFTLYVAIHSVQLPNTLYCSPIAFVQVHQIWIISWKDINRDSIWCNWEGFCWYYLFKKILDSIFSKIRGSFWKHDTFMV